jgi:hypothetical protein
MQLARSPVSCYQLYGWPSGYGRRISLLMLTDLLFFKLVDCIIVAIAYTIKRINE